MRISTPIKTQLKKPLGPVYTTLQEIKKISHGHRIIAVGDVCVLALLGLGVRPHIAVFDYRYMRRSLTLLQKQILQRAFPQPHHFRNPAGTISDKLIVAAPLLLKKGGAIRIEGEEDLTALIFLHLADRKTHVVYGQPGVGIVVAKKDARVRRILAQIFTD